MTVNEFIDKLNEMGVSGDETLRVHAFGGMRSGTNVRAVTLGLDWDMGCIVIHPEHQLTRYVPPEKKRQSTKQVKDERDD